MKRTFVSFTFYLKFLLRLRTSHETDPAQPTRPVLLLPEGRPGRADLQRAEHSSARFQVMHQMCTGCLK